MTTKFVKELQKRLSELKEQGLYKKERVISSPQGSKIQTSNGKEVLNFCSNNYLGLAGDQSVIKAAQDVMDQRGYGLSSVRFICGTQDIHKNLEDKISDFLGMEDTILYCAAFDANGGLFEPLLSADDAIISDELNHASIIDGVRLCKAERYRYKHSDMDDLERALKEASNSRFRFIVTDGVFSMDGDIARLDLICDLADKYDALVMVDDSHATGYIGKTGRGTAEHCGVSGRVDIITTTFGKALGGGNGGCTSGCKEIIEILRQKSRPYLFSNTIAPAIVGATTKVMDILSETNQLPAKIKMNTSYFKEKIVNAGFDVVNGESAIIPVMLYDEILAMKMAEKLLEEGIYVIGFVFPVVPRGKARIRIQISAAHSKEDLDRALDSFIKVGKDLNIISS
jgi:glycine C-acetyltransferase